MVNKLKNKTKINVSASLLNGINNPNKSNKLAMTTMDMIIKNKLVELGANSGKLSDKDKIYFAFFNITYDIPEGAKMIYKGKTFDGGKGVWTFKVVPLYVAEKGILDLINGAMIQSFEDMNLIKAQYVEKTSDEIEVNATCLINNFDEFTNKIKDLESSNDNFFITDMLRKNGEFSVNELILISTESERLYYKFVESIYNDVLENTNDDEMNL